MRILSSKFFFGGAFLHWRLFFFTEDFRKIFSRTPYYKFTATPVLKRTWPFDWPRSRMRIWGFFLRILSSKLFFFALIWPGPSRNGWKWLVLKCVESFRLEIEFRHPREVIRHPPKRIFPCLHHHQGRLEHKNDLVSCLKCGGFMIMASILPNSHLSRSCDAPSCKSTQALINTNYVPWNGAQLYPFQMMGWIYA